VTAGAILIAPRGPMPGESSVAHRAFGSRRVLAFDVERGIRDAQGLDIRDDVLVEFLDAEGKPSAANPPSVMALSTYRSEFGAFATPAPEREWSAPMRLWWCSWAERGQPWKQAPRLVELEFVTDGEAWAAVDGSAAFADVRELERNGWRTSARAAVEVLIPIADAAVAEVAGWRAALENLAPAPKPQAQPAKAPRSARSELRNAMAKRKRGGR
jgi:hypothetical protein